MVFDAERARMDFPILNKPLSNGNTLVYLDNAATTQKPQRVIDVMSDYYRSTNSNVHRAVHTLAGEATTAYENARERLAEWFGVGEGELILTSGTTEAINLAAHAWGRANLQEGDVVVLTEMEHHADIVPWQLLAKERSIELRWIPVDEDSLTLDLDALEIALEGAKLLCVIHTSNVIGVSNPIEELIERAHRAGARILIDAAQAAPHDRIGFATLGADMVAVSAHKMCGPTGIGALMVSPEVCSEMQPFMGGGDMIREVFLDHSTYREGAYRFEAGTPAIAETVGWAAAIDWLAEIDLQEAYEHTLRLARKTAKGLSEIPGMKVLSRNQPGDGPIVSFIHATLHADDLAKMLDAHGIAVRTGHHCAQPLLRGFGLASTNRASFYLYNTEAEVDLFLKITAELVQRFA